MKNKKEKNNGTINNSSSSHKKVSESLKKATKPQITDGNPIDLTKLNKNQIFPNTESGEIKDIDTPIFSLNNKIYYTIPLPPQTPNSDTPGQEHSPILMVGLYGSKCGYGVNPLEIYTKTLNADSKGIICGVPKLVNSNQQRTIEISIKKALDVSQSTEKRPESILTNNVISIDQGVITKILEKIQYYINLEDEMDYVLITCFILGTYLFPLFSTFGYLIISGEKGSGKGTFLDIMEKTCWNPTSKQISVTEAVLFRRIAEQRPTMIIDEYHRAIKNRNSGPALESILESGYERGGSVSRVEENKDENNSKKFRTVDFPVYCPKILATREPVEADEKGIKIIIPKIVTDIKYAKRKKELFNDLFFENIRERIMKWGLNNQERILGAYNTIEPDFKLNGREFNVCLGVLSVAKVAFPDKFDQVYNYLGNKISKNRSDTFEKENMVLIALMNLEKGELLLDGGSKLSEPSYKVTNKELKSEMEELYEQSLHHNSIKSALDNLRLVGKHETGTYYIKKSKLLQKLAERGLYTDTNSGNTDLCAERIENPANKSLFLG
ncbi:MAG: hypothetical protein KKF16_08905 [Euryarchaeota archaeon]|nr:hypothetical protein [Euryarchaeota archaeon]MBU4606989.1 hypothetical protein [Euryarchaeota archaeon]MBV1729793.1 hypothetical protein [Methanobacterium sp.]MBV1754855.1 hypothetical protein [Methanobacterium sp.]